MYGIDSIWSTEKRSQGSHISLQFFRLFDIEPARFHNEVGRGPYLGDGGSDFDNPSVKLLCEIG